MKGQVARNILRRKKCIQCQWISIRKGVWVLLRREVNDKGHKKGYRTAFFNISLPWKQTAIRWPTLLSKGKRTRNRKYTNLIILVNLVFLDWMNFSFLVVSLLMYTEDCKGFERGSLVSVFKIMKLDHEQCRISQSK